jgi:hypothetical protein
MIRGQIRWAVLSLVVGAMTLVGACKGKAAGGGSCTGDEASCTDPQTLMACVNGTYLKASCGGPQGCTTNGTVIKCDNDFAAIGDGCVEPNDVSCTTDKKGEIGCVQNHFALKAACKGPKGCSVSGTTVSCDNDYSDVGDLCDKEGDYSCSSDRKSDVTCKGPKACEVVPNGAGADIKCDHDVAAVNDPCHSDGELACSPDKGMMLRCAGLKFTNYNACRGPKACTFKEHTTRKTMEFDCDDAIAQVGDPCDTPSEVACTADGGESLICRGSAFVASKSCRTHACKLVSDFSVSCK